MTFLFETHELSKWNRNINIKSNESEQLLKRRQEVQNTMTIIIYMKMFS